MGINCFKDLNTVIDKRGYINFNAENTTSAVENRQGNNPALTWTNSRVIPQRPGITNTK